MQQSKGSFTILFCITVLLSIFTIVMSLHYSDMSGGTDLRSRVVGARLMKAGYSPYFYKWKKADGEYFLDPNDQPNRLVNGNTASPAILELTYPVTYGPYAKTRLLWTILLLFAAVLIIWILVSRYSGPSVLIPTTIVILSLLTSENWFMQVERGQITIIYVLLFAIIYYAYSMRNKSGEFISGIFGGLFIFFRPIAGILFIGFLIKGKRTWMLGWLTGVLAGLLIFVLPYISVWKDYFHAMGEYGYETTNTNHFLLTGSETVMPNTIDGASNLLAAQKFNVSSMPTFFNYFLQPVLHFTILESYILLGIIYLILCFLFLKIKNSVTTEKLFLFSFLLYQLAELFSPYWRGAYYLLEWIFPLFLIVTKIQDRFPMMLYLVFALLLFHNFPYVFRFQSQIGEMILLIIIIFLVFEEMSSSKKKLPGKSIL
jgi:hypothetical protein